jgi:hypothetical protein
MPCFISQKDGINCTMISVRLQGGLGNQLFQIFTGAALAIRTRRQLVCRHIDGNRKSYNGIYFHVREEPNNVRFRDIVEHQGQWFSILHFPNHGNLRLTGYFQNKNYFEGLFDQCAQLIRFQYPRIQDIPGTAIHVRRGDFKNHPTIFELLDLSYYESHLRNAHFERPWHIVTEAIDDPFVRQLQDLLHIETVHSGPDDFEYLVSHSNIVGANSTFSWWACYLAKRMKPNGHYVVAESFVKGHTGPSL